MAPTRGVQHEFQKLFRALFLSETAGSSVEEAGRRTERWRDHRPRDRRQGRLRSDREQRQYAPRGDDLYIYIYKLFLRAGIVLCGRT